MTVTTLPLPPHAVTESMTAPAAPPAAPKVTYIPAPTGAPTDAPRVFGVINSVMRDVMPVSKDKENQQQRYKFRGVDDAMSAMAGPMRTHGLFILPSIAEHQAERRGEKMTHVTITMRYFVYGPAGDCLLAEVPGEASDFADKATNKAQSAALKYLLFTLFMIPVDGRSIDDGDRDHPIEPTAEHRAEQAQRQGRQQQRRQQGQQARQQPRRSQRAEAGPWEQQPPQQGQQRPDYTAEAQKANSPEAFAKVRAAAAEAGAPAEFLASLDKIAAQKRAAAQQTAEQGQQQAPPPGPDRATVAAEERLRLAASRAGMQNLDADFERAYGTPIDRAAATTLNAFAAQIEKAAEQ
ncbi:ERF family protein [Streptomyces sp. NPDC051362]|uniref:ERF family protein n=1 Tax=Streptomyces sp. NPDC051362 TaxID=3365651 RepID=UPI0037877AE2